MPRPAAFQFSPGSLRCEGDWRLPDVARIERALEGLPVDDTDTLEVDTHAVAQLDLGGSRLLARLAERAQRSGVRVNYHVPDAHRNIISLVETVPRPEVFHKAGPGPLGGIGRAAVEQWRELLGFLAFVGETFHELFLRFSQPTRFRPLRLLAEMEHGGVRAVPIVAVLSFLVGVVIAYQLSTALEPYGAAVFLPELLTITILRELGPLVTAIVVAGRTASAYAAELGTMQINEEIDALRTLGVSPYDMLILPKVLGLLLVLPLLTVLADISGMGGGVLVNWVAHGQGVASFLNRLPEGMDQRHLWLGLSKTPVYAVVIAAIGCRQGLRVARGAGGVGQATTRAVVQAIFAVIVVNAVFSVVFNMRGL
ncbi:MlaE family ABC transporter permease [Thioalkalivibrio sp.]|uniref:MlaE family ABC transporter permease n=1 Tax=Thioalkalivibrio sp. TaxID=2093813 RepID=UPI003566CFE0